MILQQLDASLYSNGNNSNIRNALLHSYAVNSLFECTDGIIYNAFDKYFNRTHYDLINASNMGAISSEETEILSNQSEFFNGSQVNSLAEGDIVLLLRHQCVDYDPYNSENIDYLFLKDDTLEDALKVHFEILPNTDVVRTSPRDIIEPHLDNNDNFIGYRPTGKKRVEELVFMTLKAKSQLGAYSLGSPTRGFNSWLKISK